MPSIVVRSCLLLFVSSTAACSGSGSGTGGPPDDPVDAAASDAGVEAAAEGGAGADAGGQDSDAAVLRVFLRSDDVELCAGECTTLSAGVQGARGEVSYTWGQGLSEETSHEVCPDETTTYTVEAVDRIETPEFEQEARQATQLTVGVSSCDPESPVLCEARFRSPVPTGSNLLRSEEAWLDAFAVDSILARGPDDSMYLMGAFGNHLDLGADVLEADAGMHGFVHKLNARCEPVWTRRLDPSVSGDIIVPAAITSDAEGHVYAVSTSGPLVDLDPLAPFPFRFATEVVVYKLDAEGDEVFRTTLPLALGGGVNDVVVDDQGRLYMPGFAHAFTDFGGGPLGFSPTTYHSFLLGLDAQGAHRVTESNTAIYQFERAGDALVFVDGALGHIDFLAALLGLFRPESEPPSIVSRALPGLAERWSQSLEQAERWPEVVGGHVDGSMLTLSQDSDSQVVDEETELTSSLWVQRYDANGVASEPVAVMETNQRFVADEDGYYQGPWMRFLATAPAGLAGAVTGIYYASELQLGDGTSLPYSQTSDMASSPFGDGEIFAAKIAADDSLAWARRIDVGEGPSPLGLAMDADGHVWVASSGRVPGTGGMNGVGGERDLVVTKLRSAP